MGSTVIYPARAIHTMDSIPHAEALAIRDGHILATGSADDLRRVYGGEIDPILADKVVLPGFVEAHCHRLEGALWEFPYVGYFDRTDPEGHTWPGCTSVDAILDRLAQINSEMADSNEALIAWGMDPIYYPGDRLVAEHLDRVSPTRPIFVMHASLHLATVNSALMQQVGIGPSTTMEGVPKDGSGNPIGELQELSAMALAGDAAMRLFGALGSNESTRRFGRLARNAGITTLTDLGSTPLGEDSAVDDFTRAVDDPDFPARISVFFNPSLAGTDLAAGVIRLDELRSRSNEKLRFGHVKLVLDGSIQGFTARLNPPGYLGGQPNGLWLIPPEQVRDQVLAFHQSGAIVHAHCNGDEATEVFLDAVEHALSAAPRVDHRHTVQHCQLATPAQLRRVKAMGMCANFFANHVYYWGDQHSSTTVGPDRAARMNAAGTAAFIGLPFSLHSDAAVTPLGSLHVAWCAANRLTATGVTLGPDERISVAEALQAVTLGAAYQLKMDHEIGSIAPGKRADLAVLEADPLEIDPVELKDVPVWGTFLGGTPHPAVGTG